MFAHRPLRRRFPYEDPKEGIFPFLRSSANLSLNVFNVSLNVDVNLSISGSSTYILYSFTFVHIFVSHLLYTFDDPQSTYKYYKRCLVFQFLSNLSRQSTLKAILSLLLHTNILFLRLWYYLSQHQKNKEDHGSHCFKPLFTLNVSEGTIPELFNPIRHARQVNILLHFIPMSHNVVNFFHSTESYPLEKSTNRSTYRF